MNPPAIDTHCSLIDTSLIEVFERQAAAAPERTAVICGPQSHSFRQLSDASDALAAELQRRGIGRGDFVGIGLERSFHLIAALLGILKAGAAYIPLDPGYPSARLIHMVASSGIRQLVTTSSLAHRFPMAETLFMDALPAAPPFGTGNYHADDCIYAIFTSGSTGLAKAASVFHKGFNNLLQWYLDELDLTLNDVTLVTSSPSFDLTQKNFFAPLLSGGTLVLDHGASYDIHRITALIREHGVTLINCTPSAFYPLMEAAAGSGYSDLASLRFVVLGGEPISIPRIRPWLMHPSCGAEIVNSYGPTECTDICAFHRLSANNLEDHPFVPTGREIPNVVVTIRNELMTSLPSGEMGELCIEGIGVGGGYLNDAEKTARRFINGVYRTGDLAKRHPDGLIEFRGRLDHQVKVNGFRIELGEIESHLASHPEVRECVVTHQDGRLVAYVRGLASVPEMRAHLTDLVPAYMMPAHFHSLEKFPLTPNGKIDRNAFQTIPATNVSPANQGTPLEKKILDLWSSILGKTLDDPSANFSDLGGTSIHLAIAHVKLREMTGQDLDITDLFAHPSAQALARFLSPETVTGSAAQARDRAKLQQAGFSGFRRRIRQ